MGLSLAVAKALIDEAKIAGFSFSRTAPGDDAPLFGVRETPDFVDEIVLTGCDAGHSCYASRRARSSLLVPGGMALIKEVGGDAITVLSAVVVQW